MDTLSQELAKGSLHAARYLLGWKLIHQTPAGVTAGYIVETEAYHSSDPASHSFRGITNRTCPMFAVAGTIYVYFTYGMHYCVNIVTGLEGEGEAVLIRALEPIEGIELMRRRRGVSDIHALTSGPAKLTQAMGITFAETGSVLQPGKLWLGPGFLPEKVVQTVRIGIKQAAEKPWRFYVADSPFVSRKAINSSPPL